MAPKGEVALATSTSRFERLTESKAPGYAGGWLLPHDPTIAGTPLGDGRCSFLSIRCARAKDSVDCVAARCFTDRRGYPRDGVRRYCKALVCRIEERGPGDRLGDLVPDGIEVFDLRSCDLGICCGTCSALTSHAVVDRAARFSSEEGTL